MKKTYRIEVDCANCANLMEDAARRTAGVRGATVNFMTQKLIVEFAEGSEPRAVMQSVLAACKRSSRTARFFCNPPEITGRKSGPLPGGRVNPTERGKAAAGMCLTIDSVVTLFQSIA